MPHKLEAWIKKNIRINWKSILEAFGMFMLLVLGAYVLAMILWSFVALEWLHQDHAEPLGISLIVLGACVQFAKSLLDE